MLSAQEVAGAALAAASDAVDRLIALTRTEPPPKEDSGEAEIVLIEAREVDGLDHRDRRTWENHAALSLMTGARMVVFPTIRN